MTVEAAVAERIELAELRAKRDALVQLQGELIPILTQPTNPFEVVIAVSDHLSRSIATAMEAVTAHTHLTTIRTKEPE